MSDWKAVSDAMLGSWPARTQVGGWSVEVRALYCAQLDARGVAPDEAMDAIYSWTQDYPPSVGGVMVLVKRARKRAAQRQYLDDRLSRLRLRSTTEQEEVVL